MEFRPKIYLGMPHGDYASPAAVMFFCYASGLPMSLELARENMDTVRLPNLMHGPNFDLVNLPGCRGGSAASYNHNLLMIDALDLRDRGEATHFAMLHADVVPCRMDWLALLVHEMETHKATIMSAVVAIKERGRPVFKTSTAIGLRSDPWKGAIQYIEPTDRTKMPTTFDLADVERLKGMEHDPDHVLYVNIGCTLWDLRHPCWDKWEELGGFSFYNHIWKDKQNGSRVCMFFPEDWHTSKLVDEAGGRVMATWAVPTIHTGYDHWPSHIEYTPL